MNTSKFQQATCFLMFSALSEVILSMYDKTTLLVHYDKDLHTKFKNLKASFERASKKAHLMFPEDEQLSFMKMITVFEKLIESSKDQQKFMELMGLIESWQDSKIIMINTKNDLLNAAEDVKNGKITDLP
jgi:hypothetical protein